jgi:fatty-acyl-CoA synthase
MELNLWQVFQEVAGAVPDEEAIVTHDRRFSYAELADRSARLASVLAANGLGCHTPRASLPNWQVGQSRIAMVMHNGHEYAECLLGSFAARAVPMNVNYSYVPAEVAYVINDGEASVIVYQARNAAKIAQALPLLRQRPLLIQVADDSGVQLLQGAIDYEKALAKATPDSGPASHAAHSADDALLIYTGGTTGMPKGVIWRQGDMWQSTIAQRNHRDSADAATIAEHAASHRRRRTLVCAPMMHGAGTLSCLTTLLYGGTLVFPQITDRLDAADVWRTIERERVETMLIVGEAFAGPLLHELDQSGYDASTLRAIVTGGAPISQASRDRIAVVLPQVKLHELLGASETGGALQRTDVSGKERLDSGVFGQRPGASVTVVDRARTRRVEPGHAEPGWLAVAGQIPLGYLGDQAKTEATFPVIEGTRWSIPGDLARLRADGLIEVLGREAATINTGGEKVFAEEVEEALRSHPAVTDVAVAGRPSERWGQEVTALVQLAPGCEVDDEELRKAASRHIARYKLPKAIVRVAEIQRTAVGKIDRAWSVQVAAASGAVPAGDGAHAAGDGSGDLA